ncbi:Transient receptor potential cation channel subfamily M member 1 [Trichoplax sp. H2]|nr:Transient receptor potential cation channel subfamily M member 1 [Trichoplax sp. H2]|eukprot:RDD40890.1 Transient receptor potential cation channel subfamily M member 1 [Trichoplax sp. H2]
MMLQMQENAEQTFINDILAQAGFRSRSFGNVTLRQSNSYYTAKYIRVPAHIRSEHIYKLLHEHWQVLHPALIISILGQYKDQDQSYWGNRLCQTLNQAMQDFTVLVITDGINHSLVNSVGRMFAKQRLQSSYCKSSLLGIPIWQQLKNDKVLIGNNEIGMTSAVYDIEADANSDDQSNYLEPFHDYLVMIDTANADQQDEVRGNFLASMIKQLSLSWAPEHWVQKTSLESVPYLHILIGGDLGAIIQTCRLLNDHQPVIIVDCSGPAAQLLCHIFSKRMFFQEGNAMITDDDIQGLIAKEFHLSDTKNPLIQNCTQNILGILRKSSQVYIIKPAENFEQRLYEIIFQAYAYDMVGKLKLQILYNKLDQAQLDKALYKLCCSIHPVDDFIKKTALSRGCKSSVYALLQNGQLTLFSAMDSLLKSNTVSDHVIDTLSSLMDTMDADLIQYLTLRRLETIYQKNLNNLLTFIGLYAHDRAIRSNDNLHKLDDSQFLHKVGLRIATLLGHDYRNPYGCHVETQGIDNTLNLQLQWPVRDLFLWSILTGRYNLSITIWKRLAHPIAAAIVASRLLQSLENDLTEEYPQYCQDYPRKLKAIQKITRTYQNLALQVMDEIYSKHPKHSVLDLLQELPEWGHVSVFSLIFTSQTADDLVEHDCYYNALKWQWNGQLISYLKRKEPQNRLNDSDESTDRRKLFPRSHWFYKCTTPKILFTTNFLAYILFIILYAAFLFNFNSTINSTEIVTAVWVLSFFMDEISQIIRSPVKKWSEKLIYWIKDVWNLFDISAILVFIVAFIFRNWFIEVARILYGLDFIIFTLRLLQIFCIWPSHGPKLPMIGKMLGDLMSFLAIMLVFVIGFGVCYHALLFPTWTSPITIVKNILIVPYYRLYGELFINDQGVIECQKRNFTSYAYYNCEAVQVVVNVVVVIYLIITIILLLNLLIAIMSKSYERLQDETERIWKFQFNAIVREFSGKSIILPPFNLLTLPVLIRSFWMTVNRNGKTDCLQKYTIPVILIQKYEDDYETIIQSLEAQSRDRLILGHSLQIDLTLIKDM